MSQYFQIGEHVLWNPSNGVSRLFLDSAESLSGVLGLPSGLGPMEADECEIDLPVLVAFTDALIRRYVRSNHAIFRAFMEAFIATAIVLVGRAGGELPALPAEDPDVRALMELGRRYDRAMAV